MQYEIKAYRYDSVTLESTLACQKSGFMAEALGSMYVRVCYECMEISARIHVPLYMHAEAKESGKCVSHHSQPYWLETGSH